MDNTLINDYKEVHICKNVEVCLENLKSLSSSLLLFLYPEAATGYVLQK